MNIRTFVKWADFFVDLRTNLSEIKNSLSAHSKEIDVLRQQNILLLERIGYQSNTIQNLESRVGRLEDAAINGNSSRRAIGNTTAGDVPRLPDSLDGPQS